MPDVGDTVTTFCVGEDATAGLQASGRAIAGFARTPPGVSVLQVVFRFEDDGAATFVQQAGEILGRCNEVPDAHGLAFTYKDAPARARQRPWPERTRHVATDGVSVGSGSLRSIVGVFRRGDLGSTGGRPCGRPSSADADAVALAAFTAAAARVA